MGDVTRILNAIEEGAGNAADELLPLVYNELRKLASHRMAKLAAGQTLQPTALVHDAWVRLVGNENPRFENRRHFFAAAAEAMRHILIDNARRKQARRHGGDQQRINIEDEDISLPAPSDQLQAVNEALDKLATQRPLEAEVVKLRFFVGMTIEEVAEVIGVSVRTAKNYWAHAKPWLYQEIRSNGQ